MKIKKAKMKLKFTGTDRFNYSSSKLVNFPSFLRAMGEESKLFTSCACKPVIEVITGRESVLESLYINCVMRIFQACYTAISSLRNIGRQSLHAPNEKGKNYNMISLSIIQLKEPGHHKREKIVTQFFAENLTTVELIYLCFP